MAKEGTASPLQPAGRHSGGRGMEPGCQWGLIPGGHGQSIMSATQAYSAPFSKGALT